VWLPDEAGQVLSCGPVWFAAQPGLEGFRQASLKVEFSAGEPLLGLVWQDGRTRWADDLHVDPRSYRRAEAASAAGLRGALVVPICGPAGVVAVVVAVLEFLSRESAPDRAGVREVVGAAAAQLSSLIGQKAAEAELRGSEARFRAVAETAIDGIVVFDAAGRMVYVNEGIEGLFGYRRTDLLGSPVTRLLPQRLRPADTELAVSDVMSRLEGVIGTTMVAHVARSDGAEVPVELSLASWVEDESTYFAAILRDITERQRLEDELRQALAQERETAARLQHSDWIKNTFLDAVSHDLRGPLAALKAATTVLGLDAAQASLSVEQRRGYLARMDEAVAKMRRLLDDLLDVDRLHGDQSPLRLAPTDLGELLRSCVEEHRALFGSRTVEVDLPPVVIDADPAKVERIVENLLVNVCRHTPADARVWVSVQVETGWAVICVDDNGPGVPEEMRTLIFQRGAQVPGSSAEGVGMGLHLVDRLAALHYGQAWVQPRPGGGAAFRVRLPSTRAAAASHGRCDE
jgi:two-component system, sensor histidine kinase